jgi:hypothetical protein
MYGYDVLWKDLPFTALGQANAPDQTCGQSSICTSQYPTTALGQHLCPNARFGGFVDFGIGTNPPQSTVGPRVIAIGCSLGDFSSGSPFLDVGNVIDAVLLGGYSPSPGMCCNEAGTEFDTTSLGHGDLLRFRTAEYGIA